MRMIKRELQESSLKGDTMRIAGILSGLLFMTSSSLAQDLSPPSSLSRELLDYVDRYKKVAGGVDVLVQPGTEKEAKDYYQRIGSVLKFDFLDSTLDTLIAHFGYSEPKVVGGKIVFRGLTATDIEVLPSFTLMPRNVAELSVLADAVEDPGSFRALLSLSDFQQDAVLVSRFFAPKIATYYNPANSPDVGNPIDPDKIVPGWRKLVRIKPKKGSQADTDGIISHLYLLFNVKRANFDADPFANNESANNQVIIVPKDQAAGDRVYFGVYQGKSIGYPIGLFLNADFDLPGHVGKAVPNSVDSHYYVPRACAECHGHSANDLRGQPVDAVTGKPTEDFSTGIYRFAKPNYLDTDQWYDWRDFDYRGVSGSLNDVVFDGGRDTDSVDYSRAFDVIRKLNTTIAAESEAAESDPKTPTFQTLAARKWLQLHQNSDTRKPYSTRSIGNEAWNAASGDEMRLLRLLNNHCFRCHSSLRYNVFDRQAVRDKKDWIIAFLNLQIPDGKGGFLPGNFMPQGRVLSADEKNEIIRLLQTVFP
ncbi:hypothetical protein GOA69_33150 [Sinorhizobium meliloti]|nr:hypothetical protein [Sinorhizobium meliloti]